MRKTFTTIVECYFTEWGIKNNRPGVSYLCRTDEELADCISEMNERALKVEAKSPKGRIADTEWAFSLYELGWSDRWQKEN